MQQVVLDGIDLDGLYAVVGARTVQAGRLYRKEGRVLATEWDPREQVLSGRVRGRGGFYDVEVYFDAVRGGQLEYVEGVCDCPVGADCKHVVAVAVSAVAPRPVPPPAPAPTWTDAMESLLVPPGPVGARSGQLSLAVQLGVVVLSTPVRGRTTAAPPAPPRITARLQRPGRSGWVNGNLDWTKLGRHYEMGEFDPRHVRVLRDLYALYAARGGGAIYGYHYGDDRHLDLAAIDSPHLWTVLVEAAEVGIVLLAPGGKGRIPLPPPGRATVRIDITGPDELTVRPYLCLSGPDEEAGGATDRNTPTDRSTPVDRAAQVGPAPQERRGPDARRRGGVGDPPGHDDPPGPEEREAAGGTATDAVAVRFVGAIPHGVVWVSARDGHGRDPAEWPIRLARLAAPVSAELADQVLAGRTLRIPAQERARFDAGYAVRLRALAPLESSDGSWCAPLVTGPQLQLDLTHSPGHQLTGTLSWIYGVNGEPLSREIGSAPVGPRDETAEAVLLESVASLLRPAGLLIGDAVSTHLRCAGLDTLRFTTEVLPQLRESAGVVVREDGTPADYRDGGDTLRVAVSTTPTAEGGSDWFDLGVEVTVAGRTVPFQSLFLAMAAGEPCLLLDDGTWFALDKPELRTLRELIEEARALTDRPSGPLRISRFQAGLWEDLAALGVVAQQAAAWREQVQALLAADPSPPALPDGLAAQLRPYQVDGFHRLAVLWRHRLGGILADDMGLGKTLQALALICHARATTPADPPFLVVCPTSVLPNWAAEITRFAPGLRVAVLDSTLRRRGTDLASAVAGADVVLTTYALLRLDVDSHAAHDWSGLLLDEAQQVKNPTAAAHRAARRVPAPFKLAITGTPMENNLTELWALLAITAPGLFPHPQRFREHFTVPIEKHRDAERLATLRRRVRPLLTRRTKEQVALELPAKSQQVLSVELDAGHRRAYQRQLQRERQRLLGLIDDVDRNRFTILRSLTVLRRLALHQGLVDNSALDTGSAKIDLLVEHLTEVVAGGHRALVFSQFTGFLALVRAALDRAGLDHLHLDGRTTDRGAVVQQFRDGVAPTFLISLRAGGTGLNLTEADYVFLLDPWWNPAVEAQAIDRAHRIGQTRPVHVFRLLAADTIEEKVHALAARKAELVSGVLDSGAAFSGAWDADDIRELLA